MSNEDLYTRGKKDLSVFAEVKSSGGDFTAGVALEKNKRKLYLNSEPLNSAGEYLGRILTVSFSPTDVALVKGSPKLRRALVDRHIVDLTPTKYQNFLNYQRALKAKNALLKSGAATAELLRPWNKILAEETCAIQRERLQFLSALMPHLAEVHSFYAESDLPLVLSLSSHYKTKSLSLNDVVSELESIAEREIARRTTLIGPHRDDVKITFRDGLDARDYASQGQSRSIALSIKLAVARLIEAGRGDPPILLLDDLDSEIDRSRRARLSELLVGRRNQVFITGTERSSLYDLNSEQDALFTMISGALSGPN